MISMKRFLILTLIAAMGLTLGIAYAQGQVPVAGPQGQGGLPVPAPQPRAPFMPGPRQSMMPRAQCPTLAVSSPMSMDLLMRDDVLQPTPEQRGKITELQTKYTKLMSDAASQTQATTWALMQALASERPDAAKLQQLAAAASKADADALSVNLNLWTDLRKLLTDEQNKKLSEMIQRRLMPSLEPGMGGGMGGGFGPGPRPPQGQGPAPQPGQGPAPVPPGPQPPPGE